jgi:hypothetical protein
MPDSNTQNIESQLSLRAMRHEISNALSLFETSFESANKSPNNDVGQKLHKLGSEKLEKLIASLDQILGDKVA